MPRITIEQPSPAPDEGPDRRALYESLERLRRRIEAMAAARDTGERQLRRQRAAGRRP